MSEEINNENKEQNNEQNNEQISNETPDADNIQKTEHNNQVLKFIAVITVIFLATFAAVYTVVDMAMYKLGFQPFVELSKQIDRAFNEDFQYLETSSPAPVKIETKDNSYVVTINMKSFDNNPDNFDIDFENNGIKIKGRFFKDKNGELRENSFYQNVIFPNKIQDDNINKEIKGKKMIITIPFENE